MNDQFSEGHHFDKSEVHPVIMCIGGHPDDPESGCGGTLAKWAKEGSKVYTLYLTTGEAGIPGQSHYEAANIRKKEAKEAVAILGAQPIFFGQIDGSTIVNNGEVLRLIDTIKKYQPDIIYTHWPIDSHKDHQVASLLTTQAWHRLGKSFDVYFYEVCYADQTSVFNPTHYIDITATKDLKRKAVYCHQSQNPQGIYFDKDCNHDFMERMRGIEAHCEAAEAFILLR